MKKIFSILLLSLLICGVASASAIHGDYNGRPIIKVVSNGHELEVIDAPAVLMDGRTMVPIYMLRELGAYVGWNQETYTVTVELDRAISNHNQPQKESAIEITRTIIANGGAGVTIMNMLGSLTAVTYYPSVSYDTADLAQVTAILMNLSKLEADYARVQFTNGEYVEARSKDL